MEGLAAVDHDRLPRHEVRAGPAEERDGARDVVRPRPRPGGGGRGGRGSREGWAAADHDGLPGQEAGAGPEEERDGARDVAGRWSRWIVRADTDTSRSFSTTSGCASTPADIVKP